MNVSEVSFAEMSQLCGNGGDGHLTSASRPSHTFSRPSGVPYRISQLIGPARPTVFEVLPSLGALCDLASLRFCPLLLSLCAPFVLVLAVPYFLFEAAKAAPCGAAFTQLSHHRPAIRRGLLPSEPISHSDSSPLRVEMNAIWLPSGDHAGYWSAPLPVVSC